MLDWIIKYWVEVLFGLICGGVALLVRHHLKLFLDAKKKEKEDMLKKIDEKFDEQNNGMTKKMGECYNNLIEVVKESEEKSMEEDRVIHKEIDTVKTGVLSIEGAYFKQQCRRLLEKDYYITSHDFETLTTEHGVYNSLGGNHEGDELYKLVQEKVRNQLFKQNN